MDPMRRALAVAAALLATSIGVPAGAQVGFGQPGPPQPTQAQPPPGMETHAASGADDPQKLQTQEPSLPVDPLYIPPAAKKKLGTDSGYDEYEKGRTDEIDRDFYGLYYAERSGSYQFRTAFPVWVERTQPQDRASLYGLTYYNRRSKEMDADVLFPFFWKLRDDNTYTTVVGPWMHRERESRAAAPGVTKVIGRHDNWLAPLWFEGKTDDGGGYFHVPPLLTFTQHTAKNGFNLVGPMFCKWKGGPSCD